MNRDTGEEREWGDSSSDSFFMFLISFFNSNKAIERMACSPIKIC